MPGLIFENTVSILDRKTASGDVQNSQGYDLMRVCNYVEPQRRGFTPFICGQFVDRILSTQPIRAGKELEKI